VKTKKLKLEIPSWLWFPIYYSAPSSKWNDEKEKLAQHIKQSLKNHLELHGKPTNICEPNLNDNVSMYGFEPDKERIHKEMQKYVNQKTNDR